VEVDFVQTHVELSNSDPFLSRLLEADVRTADSNTGESVTVSVVAVILNHRQHEANPVLAHC